MVTSEVNELASLDIEQYQLTALKQNKHNFQDFILGLNTLTLYMSFECYYVYLVCTYCMYVCNMYIVAFFLTVMNKKLAAAQFSFDL